MTDPKPIRVSTCFDGLEITVNHSLLDLMQDHLMFRGEHPSATEDTGFDRWLHGQVYTTEFNNY